MTPEHAELVRHLNEAIAEGAGPLADATRDAITALSEENERLRADLDQAVEYLRDVMKDTYWSGAEAFVRRITGCQCPACRDGARHSSDCAVHNEPAMPNGPCDCGTRAALGEKP